MNDGGAVGESKGGQPHARPLKYAAFSPSASPQARSELMRKRAARREASSRFLDEDEAPLAGLDFLPTPTLLSPAWRWASRAAGQLSRSVGGKKRACRRPGS